MSTNVQISNDDVFRQHEDVRKREAELQRRQQEFERQQNMATGGRASQPHNWPPLPQFIPLEPCFYQVYMAF